MKPFSFSESNFAFKVEVFRFVNYFSENF
jgi:hypothetical protein